MKFDEFVMQSKMAEAIASPVVIPFRVTSPEERKEERATWERRFAVFQANKEDD